MKKQIHNPQMNKQDYKINLYKKNTKPLPDIKENEVKINYFINIKKLYNPNYTSSTNYLKTRFSSNRQELKSIEKKFDIYLKVHNNQISSKHVHDVSNMLSYSKLKSLEDHSALKPNKNNIKVDTKNDKDISKVKRKKTIDENIDIYAESDSDELDKEIFTDYIQKINSKYNFFNHSDVYRPKNKIKNQKNYILSRNYIDHYINTRMPRNNLPYLKNYDKGNSNWNFGIKNSQALSVKRIKKFVFDRLRLDTE